MKKLLSILLSVVLLLSICPIGLFEFTVGADENTTEFAGGSGTPDDPYLISTKEHLNNVRLYLDANYKMIADIEFTDEDFSENGDFYNDGLGWSPINGFRGTFDGSGFLISNLNINGVDQVGLFGKMTFSNYEQGSVYLKNIILNNCKIRGRTWVGGIVGYVDNANSYKKVFINNCFVSGAITGSDDFIGGICGLYRYYDEDGADITAFSECYNSAEVVGKNSVGGIIGVAYSTKYDADIIVSNCCNTGKISGESIVGGLVGESKGYKSSVSTAETGTIIINSYNSGNIEGNGGKVGGIVGYTTKGKLTLTYTYSSGSSTGSGLVGGQRQANPYYTSSCFLIYPGAENDTFGYKKSSAEMEETSNYIDWDFDSVWTMDGDENYAYPELRCFTLRGEPIISGMVAYNSTVTASTERIENPNSTITYEWLVDGVRVGTESSYKLTAEQIGKKLQLKMTSTAPMKVGSLYSKEITVSKAVQTEEPVIPELQALDDKSFEIRTVSTQEYSINNTDWQKNGVFVNLDPNKKYTIHSRIIENDLYLTGESKVVLTVTTERRPLNGVVNITGTSRYGDTLTADVSGILPKNATFNYEWKRNGQVVGNGTTYTIAKPDIGNNITLSVKGTGDFIGTKISTAVTATKTTVQLPNAPIISDTTNTSVTLINKVGYEYSKDKATWQNSPIFTGLSAATEYTFYQRVKETDTTFASKISNGTNITTLKNSVAAPQKPIVINITNISVALKNIPGYEYSLDGLTWQTSNVFSGLNPFTEYSFCQRIAETDTDYASAQSGYTIVMTLKNSVTAPNAPTILKATDSSVTLVAINGYEYSKDGTLWQKSNVFNGLTVLNTYKFYQRVAETNTDYASAASKPIAFKVKNIAAKTNSPALKEKSNNKIVIITDKGKEYSIDGNTWQASDTFNNLKPNTQYGIFARTIESDTYYAGECSDPLIVITLKNAALKPTAPIVSNKTADTVTLIAGSGYEYSKDGTSWQKSNIFTNLLPNTKYTFYQRVAESNTNYASDTSDSVTVTTLKRTANKPASPTVSNTTFDSVTLNAISGCEYSKDGTIWQESNIFDGLSPNTVYHFYQRVAETNISYASEKSSAFSVTTLKKNAYKPNAPILIEVTQTTVKLQQITAYEYSKDGLTWQLSSEFTGLMPNATYTFYQRVAETTLNYAGKISEPTSVKTLAKLECLNTPEKPIAIMVDYKKITLLAKEGYEYRIDGGEWQASSEFTELVLGKTYTFYQRIKETPIHKASKQSAALTITLDLKLSTKICYQLLLTHIDTYGSLLSNGNKEVTIYNTADSGKNITITCEKRGNSLYCKNVGVDKDNRTKLEITTYFYLTAENKNITANESIKYYVYSSLNSSSNLSGNFDRSTYTNSKTILVSGGSDSEKKLLNTSVQLICSALNLYLMKNFGISIGGIGFLDYAELNDRDAICDEASDHHVGNIVLKYNYAATCESDGYTGDYCCSNCGAVITKGKIIPSLGGHQYSNSCDSQCNRCDFKRDVEHIHTDDCDDTCNSCGLTRIISHVYDSECDSICNICGHERKVTHIFDNKDDLICNNCGYERPAYTPGDTNGDEEVADADAVYLLMHTFFPEDYPVNQDCDFNGDQVVTDADAVYLLMYTFFPEDYPLH